MERLDKVLASTGRWSRREAGELAHRLLSPKKHMDKRYYAQLDGSLGRRTRPPSGRGSLPMSAPRVVSPGEAGSMASRGLSRPFCRRSTSAFICYLGSGSRAGEHTS